MSRGLIEPLAATGEAYYRAGSAYAPTYEFRAPEDGSWPWEDLQGRTFLYRIRLASPPHTQLLQVTGTIVTGEDSVERVRFELTALQTAALLPDGQSVRDLEHYIVEETDAGDRDLMAPLPVYLRA